MHTAGEMPGVYTIHVRLYDRTFRMRSLRQAPHGRVNKLVDFVSSTLVRGVTCLSPLGCSFVPPV